MVHSLKQDAFIVMSYRNRAFNNDEWTCSDLTAKNRCLTKYPNVADQEMSLVALIRDLINRFLQVGSVNEGKSTGRLPES
jgi:hypothetical protein